MERENKIRYFDKINRKKNLIIFGLKGSAENVLEFVFRKLSEFLEIAITSEEINNIYFKGKNIQPIQLELV